MQPTRRLALALLAASFVCACPDDDPDAADAGSADAGFADASATDTTSADAASADAASTDAASTDAASTDAASVDAASALDAASPDSSAADARSSDAGLAQDSSSATDSGFDASLTWPPDPDAPPVTTGSWYRPGVATTWQWQLSGTLNSSYDVGIYDLDLFDTTPSTIATLQGQGRRVLCYFSAGSSENWRDDFSSFDSAVLGNNLDGWPGERWLDIRARNVAEVMLARLDLAASKGCDGVEPDNVDGYTNNPGFAFNAQDQRAYNRWMANAAHQRGLAVALKNDLDQISQLVSYYDLSVNEECHSYSECGLLAPFTQAGKPVLNAEYADSAGESSGVADSVCPSALSSNLRSLILPWDLDDSFRISCDDR